MSCTQPVLTLPVAGQGTGRQSRRGRNRISCLNKGTTKRHSESPVFAGVQFVPVNCPFVEHPRGSARCYTVAVRRKPIIWIVFALLAVLLAGPVFEFVDHWDNIPETGNDTVLSVVLLLTCAGAMFAVRRFTAMAIKLLYRLKHRSTAPQTSISPARRDARRFELDSGPVPSLSSLRI